MFNSAVLFARESTARPLSTPDQISSEAAWPIMICLLGQFRLLKAGEPLPMRNAAKAQALLSSLALNQNYAAPRETLLSTLWPDTGADLAGQSLNSLVHSLRKQLGIRSAARRRSCISMDTISSTSKPVSASTCAGFAIS